MLPISCGQEVPENSPAGWVFSVFSALPPKKASLGSQMLPASNPGRKDLGGKPERDKGPGRKDNGDLSTIRIPEKAIHVWALIVQWGDFQEEI